MKNLVNSLAKYTGLTADELTTAFEAIEDEIQDDVQELFYNHVSIDTDGSPADWTVDPGNFIDALFDYYTVEAR